MKQIRKRLTYANVMSSLAVFLILGGGAAYAALGKNTVGTKQLKKNAVTTQKVKNGAVTTGKLANGAVTSEKLADNAVTTSKISNDAVTGDKVKESTLGQVPSAAIATNASNATTANGPIAFAHVSAGGTLLDARGVSLVAGANENFYCFTGLAFEPRGVQATTDYWNGTPRFNTMVQAGLASSGGLGGTGCPAGTQAFAHGTQADNDALSKAAIYVIFFE